jgi:hypothetical protein
MGYQLRSVLAVQPTDTHRFFVYYIPGSSFRFRWIDDWITSRLNQIAEELGGYKDGVIIFPSSKREEEFIASIGEAIKSNPNERARHIFFDQLSNLLPADLQIDLRKDTKPLYSGEPLLIISRSPLQIADENEAVIIDLAVCQTTDDLGFVFDVILQTIRRNDMKELEELNHLERKRIREAVKGDEHGLPVDIDFKTLHPIIEVGFSLNRLLGMLSNLYLQSYRPYQIKKQ